MHRVSANGNQRRAHLQLMIILLIARVRIIILIMKQCVFMKGRACSQIVTNGPAALALKVRGGCVTQNICAMHQSLFHFVRALAKIGRAYRVLVLIEAGPATISTAERRKLDDR